MKSAWFGSALAGLLATTAAATGQSNYRYLLTVDYGPGESSIHEDNPDATIRVWATREDSDHAIASCDLDMVAGEAGWTAFHLEMGIEGLFGASPGVLSGDGRTVVAIIANQFGDFGPPCASTERPTLIWEGTWVNASSDYSNRDVMLATANTHRFSVFTYPECFGTTFSRIDQLVPGAAAITITPAPGAIGFTLFSGALAFARRRHDA